MKTTSNVVTLPGGRGAAKTKTARGAYRRTRASRRRGAAAAAVGGVATLLTGLSLTHLSRGIELVTHAPAWEAWAMAAGVDLGFVALELASLVAGGERAVRALGRYIWWTVAGTLLGSAFMNALAFGGAAEGWMVAPAVAFGLAIPAMIYSLTRVGATMWIAR